MAPKAQYIAEVYHDLLGGNEWGLVRNSAGGITGIHSLSEDVPAKVSEFASENEQFIGKSKYSEWVFQYVSDLRPSRPLVAIVSETLKRINPRATKNHELPSAIVRGEPLPCGIQGTPSGSILVSFDDKDGNAEYSSGDTLELTFIQCYDPLGKITSGGKLKFTFTNIVGAPFQQIMPWSFTADLHFSGFELRFADQNLLQVNVTMVWTQAKDNADETLIQVSGARLSVKRTDDNILITNYLVKFNDNVRTDEYRQSGTQSVSSSKLGGTFQMDVSEALPLVGIASSFPDSGTIKITGAGSSITLNAVDRINVRIELDSNLDGIVDSSEVIAWSILS